MYPNWNYWNWNNWNKVTPSRDTPNLSSPRPIQSSGGKNKSEVFGCALRGYKYGRTRTHTHKMHFPLQGRFQSLLKREMVDMRPWRP